jgi:hypothetical protein
VFKFGLLRTGQRKLLVFEAVPKLRNQRQTLGGGKRTISFGVSKSMLPAYEKRGG